MRRTLLLFVLLLAPAASLAHGVEHTRLVALDVAPGRLRLTFTLELGREEADRARRLFDRDRDGRLSADEAGQLTTFLTRRAEGGFEVRDDGKILARRRISAEARRLDERRESLELQLVDELAVPKGGADWTIEDGGDVAGHVPLSVQASKVQVRCDAPRAGRGYDLPARTRVRLRLDPE